jgi:hypothetical protein
VAFPALLEPLLAAPTWWTGNPEIAYRLTQGLHAWAISLGAVPVYLICLRLGLPRWQRLASAALFLLLPAHVFSAYITADAVALTLVLAAVAAGLAALDTGTRRSQGVFVVLCALAAFARVQYVILPLAFAAAAVVAGNGRIGAATRRYRLSLALFALPAVAVLAAGPSRALGYYDAVLHMDVQPVEIARWAATDAMLMTYAAGWVLVPGAIVGVALALTRPREPVERAFAALVSGFAALLLVEAAVYAANGSARFQERYLIALAPLVAPSFFMAARRLPSKRVAIAIATIAGLLMVLAATVPLSGFTAYLNKQDSPFLQSVHRLEEWAGVGEAAMLVSALAVALAGLVAWSAFRPRSGLPLAIGAGAVALLLTSIGAVVYDVERSGLARDAFLGPQPSWIDAAGVGQTDVLLLPGALRPAVSQQLFWNTRLARLLRMDGAAPVDTFGDAHATVSSRGELLADGRPVRRPVLVEQYGSWAELDAATVVNRTVTTTLWRPRGSALLKIVFAGRYFDGWLSAETRLTVWPRVATPRCGTLRLRLGLPAHAPQAVLDVRGTDTHRPLVLRPGLTRTLAFDVRAIQPWTVVFRSRRPFVVTGSRFVAAQSSVPSFTEFSCKKP